MSLLTTSACAIVAGVSAEALLSTSVPGSAAFAVEDFLFLAAEAPELRLARRWPGASPDTGMLFSADVFSISAMLFITAPSGAFDGFDAAARVEGTSVTDARAVARGFRRE
jgi:hypothetical protein